MMKLFFAFLIASLSAYIHAGHITVLVDGNVVLTFWIEDHNTVRDLRDVLKKQSIISDADPLYMHYHFFERVEHRNNIPLSWNIREFQETNRFEVICHKKSKILDPKVRIQEYIDIHNSTTISIFP